MKKVLSFLLLVLLSVSAWAQTTVSGVVRDSEGPVASASITVEEPGKDAILAYVITNAKGEYKLTFNSSESTLDLKIKAYNHKNLSKNINNTSATHNFTLETEATEIQEVKLKARIITKKGDTISYDIKAFENKADRTLADVMKKIPGIEVHTDGTILYQGNPINKFYVNGKDLMEGGYGTINNSLPKDAVQKVEVLENHQPVKILQDKIPSEQAALNVVLKKSVTMTGRGEVGAGFSPLLWNVKLTPMFFGQKNQWVVNYKTNNNGESVENEGNMLAFGSRWEGFRGATNQNSWLGVNEAGTPSLPEKRYLLNNVHFLSANLLTSPFKNKEWELKANGSYTNNEVTRESYSRTIDYQNNTEYSTDFKNKFYTNKAKGEVIFTKNAKKGFFKNTTTFNQFWNTDRADANIVDIYGSRLGGQGLNSPTSSFQNSLSTIIPWKEKLINVMSYINYQNDRQTLEITPSSFVRIPTGYGINPVTNLPYISFFDFQNADFAVQNFGLRTFTANHSANVGFTYKGWTFTPEVGYNYSSNDLNSHLFGVRNGGILEYSDPNYRLINDISFTNSVPYASVGINYKNDAWMVFSSLPVNFNNIRADDRQSGVLRQLNKTTFEPNAFVQYSFASFWKAGANANVNYSFADVDDVYTGYILRSPSSFSAMDANNPINENLSKNFGGRIEYRNPLNNIFFNVRYNYGTTKRNLTANTLNAGLGASSVQYLAIENKTETNNYSAEFGKYFAKAKTNASINYRNTRSNSFQIRNNVEFESENTNQALGFKFNNTYFSWMSVDYNMSYSWTNQNNISGSDNTLKGYNHNLALFFYPIDNHTIGFNWDQVNSTIGGEEYKNPFFDLSYQYTWSKKKIDFEVKWLNIANKKSFETYSLSGFTENYMRYALRPSQVMFTVKFNFK